MFILYSLLRSAVTYGLFIVVVSLISLESTLIFGRLISCAVSVGALLLWCGYTYGYVVAERIMGNNIGKIHLALALYYAGIKCSCP